MWLGRAIEQGCKAVHEHLAQAWQAGPGSPLQDLGLQSQTAWAMLVLVKAPSLTCSWGGHDMLPLLSHQVRAPLPQDSSTVAKQILLSVSLSSVRGQQLTTKYH